MNSDILLDFVTSAFNEDIMLSLPLSIWPMTLCQVVVCIILNGMMYDCMVTSDWIICLGHIFE